MQTINKTATATICTVCQQEMKPMLNAFTQEIEWKCTAELLSRFAIRDLEQEGEESGQLWASTSHGQDGAVKYSKQVLQHALVHWLAKQDDMPC